ncbi:hypothetical protein LTS17_010134 [Exophiala oligosperma]
MIGRDVLKAFVLVGLTASLCAGSILQDLGPKLSPQAWITTNNSTAVRWSDYHPPTAGYYVHVAEEADVATTVKYCNNHNIGFLAQSGGRGWSTTFNTTKDYVIMDLRNLNFVVINGETKLAHVGGGANFGEIVDAAYENGLQMVNGGCNCVGQGALLGGGLSRFSNRYGMALDQILSANLVTAEGQMIAVSNSSHPDLFWALKGAGANFGIVTSTLQKAYPVIDDGMVWYGVLSFPRSKLEGYIDALNNLNLTEDMVIHWGFNYDTPNSTGTPIITSQVFFWRGDAEAGKKAFKPLYDLDPFSDTTQVMPTTDLNSYVDGFCEVGGRKPGWHVGLKSLDYNTFSSVWDRWVDFVNGSQLYHTEILVETYYTEGIRRAATTKDAAYAQRDVNHFAMTIPYWEDPSMDREVQAYGSGIRNMFKNTSGFNPDKMYINFAYGDEPLEEIYGDSLPRLRTLKKQWDPNGKFNQWFPIV